MKDIDKYDTLERIDQQSGQQCLSIVVIVEGKRARALGAYYSFSRWETVLVAVRPCSFASDRHGLGISLAFLVYLLSVCILISFLIAF
jgi:hypothetical protein